MKSKHVIEKFATGMHIIFIEKKAVDAFLKDGNKRVICKLNNDLLFHCAILSTKEGKYFINIGATICKKLSLKVGSSVTAEFFADTTTYQFDMPEEFQEVLDTDEAAHTIFHSLTEGNQRGLIYLVQQVKSTDKKIERALKIAERIKAGITSPKLVLKK